MRLNMKWLEDEIIKRGKILDGNILKVNSFLNHQLDIELLNKMTLLWFDHFKRKHPTKILTIEASGIALATLLAQRFNIPALFAKKGSPSNLGEAYHTDIYSYTRNEYQTISVEKTYLNENDSVLIVDDFLATGEAARGLINICKNANCEIVGIGTVIEKGFQHGGDKLREDGFDVYSLEIIESMDSSTGKINFR